MKIICSVVGHSRSAKLAKFDYSLQRWRSVCRHCNAEMVRCADRGWELAEAQQGAEPSSSRAAGAH